jgi:DNA repair exonuclease SbcCD ATPase subunit
MGMAYLRAWAEVRDTPVEELQDRLRDALEREHETAHQLGCSTDGVFDAVCAQWQEVEDLKKDVEAAESDVVNAESERDEARERLEKKLQDEPDAQTLREELVKVKADLVTERKRNEELQSIAELYAAALAAARKFVSVAEVSGVRAKSVRRVKE